MKICGLATVDDVRACADTRELHGVGVLKNPRNITISAARELALATPGLAKVALWLANPSDAELDAITGTVPLDMVPSRGNARTRGRGEGAVWPAARDEGGWHLRMKTICRLFRCGRSNCCGCKTARGAEIAGRQWLSFD